MDNFELLSQAVIASTSLSVAALPESELHRLKTELLTAAREGRASAAVERLVEALHRTKELTQHPLPRLTEQVAGLLGGVRRVADLRSAPAGQFERSPKRDWTTMLGRSSGVSRSSSEQPPR